MLVIVADDYGYAAPYDEGILEAVRAQAVDAVSVMVLRDPQARALTTACEAAEIDVGLHLERLDAASAGEQLSEFERRFGDPPAYLDGHHHCHAEGRVARDVALLAADLGISVRAVGAAHRALLRSLGVPAADRLVGRLAEGDPFMPDEVNDLLGGDSPAGVTEWVVHPGHAGGPSTYDEGREEDLAELLRLGDRARWRGGGVLREPPSRARLE